MIRPKIFSITGIYRKETIIIRTANVFGASEYIYYFSFKERYQTKLAQHFFLAYRTIEVCA